MIGPSYLKRINQARILNLLRLQGGMSRAEVARRLTLTRSTVSLLAADLLERNIIVDNEHFLSSQTTGRPGVGMQLNPEGGYFIGVEIGVERIRAVALNLMVDVLGSMNSPLQAKDPSGIVDQAVSMIGKLTRETIGNRAHLYGIGFSIPAILSKQGVVEYSLTLGWRDVDLRAALQSRLRVPIYLENDANAAALAEFYFGATDVDENLFCLLLDVGVGGGMIVDGKIYTGSFGAAGEIGHLRLPLTLEREKEVRTKSFEDCVGKRALMSMYRKTAENGKSFGRFCANVDRGDAAAVEVVSHWADLTALGIVCVIDMINPGSIVIGGPLSRFFPFISKSLEALLYLDPFPAARSVQLAQSRFRENACVMGGAAIVYESLFRIKQPD